MWSTTVICDANCLSLTTNDMSCRKMGQFKANQTSIGLKSVRQSKTEGKSKKTFDKAKWREQKYSNKAKLNRFEERRKKTVLREYYKELKRSDVAPRHAAQTSCSTANANPNRSLKPHEMAKIEAERIKQCREIKRLESQQMLAERKNALDKYKDKKKARFSKLSKKTQRGQPLMAGRMELLLEKIQKGM